MGFDMDEMKKIWIQEKQEMMRSYMGMMISLIIQVLAFILLLSNLPINDLVDGVIWGVVLAVGVVWTETIGVFYGKIIHGNYFLSMLYIDC